VRYQHHPANPNAAFAASCRHCTRLVWFVSLRLSQTDPLRACGLGQLSWGNFPRASFDITDRDGILQPTRQSTPFFLLGVVMTFEGEPSTIGITALMSNLSQS
jgi:hypothetical protein